MYVKAHLRQNSAIKLIGRRFPWGTRVYLWLELALSQAYFHNVLLEALMYWTIYSINPDKSSVAYVGDFKF